MAADGATGASAVPEGYRELDSDGVREWLVGNEDLSARLGVDDDSKDAVIVREVTDGNLNRVFIADGPGGSLCVKQALPYVRVVPTWPLPLSRLTFEAAALRRFGAAAAGTPVVHAFDQRLALMAMECLRPHVVLRGALVAGGVYPRLAADVGAWLATVSVATSDANDAKGAGDAKRAAVAEFEGNVAMAALTEEVVFTCPYVAAPSFANRNTAVAAVDAAAAAIVDDSAMATAAARLRASFRSSKEVLSHGDLHTGSLMVTDDETRVIDAEFAFYGPMGFDIGMFIANLAFAYLAAGARARLAQQGDGGGAAGSGSSTGETGDTGDATRWLAQQRWLAASIVELWTTFAATYTKLCEEQAASHESGFAASMLPEVSSRAELRRGELESAWAEACGFAGLELVRRTVGVAHVDDLESITPESARAPAELAAIRLARWLLVAGPSIQHAADVVAALAALDAGAASALRDVEPLQACTLVLVAKHPTPGKVKTRLSASGLGDERAAAFARASLLDTAHRFSAPSADTAASMFGKSGGQWLPRLLFAPEERAAELQAMLEDGGLRTAAPLAGDAGEWQLWPARPSDGSLGDRLRAAHHRARDSCWGPVIFVGGDCPDLPWHAVAEAAREAAHGRAYVLPAQDGGYALLAVPPHCPGAAFGDTEHPIGWSTAHTFADQARALQGAGVRVIVGGPAVADVDDGDSLAALRASVVSDDAAGAALREQLPRLAAFFRE